MAGMLAAAMWQGEIPALFGAWFLCVIFMGFLGLITTVFWIWMIVDCAMHEPSEGNDKIVWILVLIFTQVLGALIYLVVRRPERIRRYGH
jgi:hypothetical protein